ncbi:M3 family metallopeptidase [Faecalibacter rhinopitheci]|uniref:M3 family metallopeptidase n=1 Tax=Faecalibacter rhinopitheci TaxID=2779678 RepID=A0A8J7K3P7_9FLAO|nr:M3 family metallopeptidase [Faecalibacter rhinopitheci]MBF0596434.1 M3 family metallopeptidase [Faecalibacter rhinopitheci]
MLKKKLFFGMLVGSTLLMNSCSKSEGGSWDETNYFYAESSLPYGTTDFSKLKTSDFKPALLEGMRQQLEEIKIIATNTEAPTFENTLVELEKSGQLLGRVSSSFNVLTGTETNDELQAVEEELSPKFAAHNDAIYLNTQLYNRVKTLYTQKEQLNLDTESNRLLEEYHQKFVLAGADLPDAEKEKLKKVNEEIASLNTKFGNQLMNATKSGGVVFSKEELEGLSQQDLDALKQEDGTYKVSLLNTTQQPELQTLNKKETRQKLYDAAWNRTSKGDTNDTRQTILDIANKRAEKAKLLGYENFAQWSLQSQMAKTPEAVNTFLGDMISVSTKMAEKEAEEIQNLINQEEVPFELSAADWNYYAEKIRKSKYDLDENEIKPYLEVWSILENGVFFMANKLYGMTYVERKDIPTWNKEVRVYELFNEDKTPIGLFYVDFFKRDSKQGGAWMSNIVEQSTLLNQKPVIYNVCNYTKAPEGQPTLITFDDAITMFHEFGHALHGLFATQKYPSLSGTNVARDFVEFPSQFHEHFATYPEVLKNYAKHYKTGDVMPDALIDKMEKAKNFNKGYALTEILSASALDMSWHTIGADQKLTDAEKFEQEALVKNNTALKAVPPRYRSTFFSHVFGGGYAAGYYAYLWAEMLDHDAFQWLQENGGLTRENGQILRDKVFSRGNSEDYTEMYKKFRGKEASVEPMLKYHGLK